MDFALVTAALDRLVDWHQRTGLLNVAVVTAALAVFALQKRYPIDRPQGGCSYATSAGWYMSNGIMIATVFAAHYAVMAWIFGGPLSFATTDFGAGWPLAARIVLWLFVSDVTSWWVHRLRHTVPLLWGFHSVHHSAEHMSYWVVGRSHPVDGLVGRTLILVPIFMAGETLAVIGTVAMVRAIHGQLLHSNLRTRAHWVQALIVTPQWHRMHHSSLVEHRDRNFGGIFTIWDKMFGTAAVPARDDFPPIGVDRACFPADAERVRDVPRAMARQFIAPFGRLLPSGRTPQPEGSICQPKSGELSLEARVSPSR